MNRLQFFAQLRKRGFSKSTLQMTRMGTTYEKRIPETGTVRISIAKKHEKTVIILGPVNYSGIWVDANSNSGWGNRVSPADYGLGNMLEFSMALVDEDLIVEARQ